MRRLSGEPVARILGSKTFWGLDFLLDTATLVPRPETEMLVRRGLEEIAGIDDPALLDLGTGTGCIPVSLLVERADATAMAVDLAPAALAAAKKNAVKHGVANRLTLVGGSWFERVPADARFDLVTANPPYVESGDIPTLATEVRDHDPALALDGGPDGLDGYRAICREAGRYLAPTGTLLLEIGAAQGAAVRSMLAAAGFAAIEIERDLSGLERMIVAKLR